MNYSKEILEAGLKIKAFQMDLGNPFTFVSGYRMPFYINNREFLWFPEYRRLIAEAFMSLIESEKIKCDVVAGVATSGIPFAQILADLFEPKKPFIYVRSKPKNHGTGNQIEGVPRDYSLEGKDVVLIEDLFSFGTSSIPCVLAIRNAGGICNNCLAVADYEFEEAKENFSRISCNKHSLVKSRDFFVFVNGNERDLLEEWVNDPRGWGEKHGFPRIGFNKNS